MFKEFTTLCGKFYQVDFSRTSRKVLFGTSIDALSRVLYIDPSRYGIQHQHIPSIVQNNSTLYTEPCSPEIIVRARCCTTSSWLCGVAPVCADIIRVSGDYKYSTHDTSNDVDAIVVAVDVDVILPLVNIISTWHQVAEIERMFTPFRR